MPARPCQRVPSVEQPLHHLHVPRVGGCQRGATAQLVPRCRGASEIESNIWKQFIIFQFQLSSAETWRFRHGVHFPPPQRGQPWSSAHSNIAMETTNLSTCRGASLLRTTLSGSTVHGQGRRSPGPGPDADADADAADWKLPDPEPASYTRSLYSELLSILYRDDLSDSRNKTGPVELQKKGDDEGPAPSIPATRALHSSPYSAQVQHL